MSKNKRYLILFLFIVTLPGIALIALGVRTLHQEKMAVDQAIHARLDSVSGKVEENIIREFEQWIASLQNLPVWSQIDLEHLPRRLKVALSELQGSILVKLDDGNIETIPGKALLYSLKTSVVAENSDIRSLYNKARQLRKNGNNLEAISVYEIMRQNPKKYLGGVPADLVSHMEICSVYQEISDINALSENALAFYENLVKGRWLIEKPIYLHYAARAKEWFGSLEKVEELNRLIRLETYKREITEIVESRISRTVSFLEDQNKRIDALKTEDGIVFALLYRTAEEKIVLALLLSPTTLANQFWPKIFSEGDVEKYNVTITTSDGLPLYASSNQMIPPESSEERFVRVAGSSWILTVWPIDEQQFYSDFQLKQIIYISIFILFILSLGFAGYFSVRTLYQELEVVRLKENFVSAVSHEFRTPLTGIRQIVEMLIAGRVSEEQKRSQYYSMILQESDQMSRMVENLLAYSRKKDKGDPYRMERMDTNRWLRETVSQFQKSIACNDINVIFDAPDSFPEIMGDPDALSLALTNLMDNAVKYSPNDARVEISAEANNEWITIRVSDNGIGISDEDKNKIFDRFHRGSDPYVRQKGGTGIGLSLVQDIVTAHRGDIRVDGTPGEGSVFTVSLPVANGFDHGEPS